MDIYCSDASRRAGTEDNIIVSLTIWPGLTDSCFARPPNSMLRLAQLAIRCTWRAGLVTGAAIGLGLPKKVFVSITCKSTTSRLRRGQGWPACLRRERLQSALCMMGSCSW